MEDNIRSTEQSTTKDRLLRGSARRRLRSLGALFLSALLLLSACGRKEYATYHLGEANGGSSASSGSSGGSSGSGTGTEEPGTAEEDDGGSIFGRVSKKKPDDGGSGGSGGDTGGSGGSTGETEPSESDDGGFVVNDEPDPLRQLTEEDIQKMNNGKAVIVRSNNGYVSTLVGRYYNKKITVIPKDIRTYEDAIDSLNGIASLLGLSQGTEFLAYDGSQDKEGYTYLSYQQRSGDITVENATMHIVIDPEGYACAVSCSFVPDKSRAKNTSMTPDQAVSIVRNYAAQCGYPNLNIYEDATVKAAIPVLTQIHNCYVVFSDNPDGLNGFESMRYYKWFISVEPDADEQILMILPSSTLTVSLDSSYYPTNEYFENLEPVTWSGRIDLMNSGVQDVEITVSYNKLDGRYYMIDPVRKIAVADCYQFLYGSGIDFLSNTENRWEERDIAAMLMYEQAYDAYANIGIRSPDGFETPILLLRNYCDENREPVNNACYMAQFMGWFTFCYSTANNYVYDLDVIGHEYTHAVTEACILGNNYNNDAGAINEAYSDIMGNLIEYMAGKTTDTLWLNGENSNEAVRQMSDPVRFHQPDCVGGPYYVPNVDYPIQNFNDNGGVHTNSGIINYAAYLMYKAGLDYKTMFDLFYTSMNVLTPANSFADVYAALIYSARSNGYTQFEEAITEAFRTTGVLANDREVQERMGSRRDGYGSLYLNVAPNQTHMYVIQVYDPYTEELVAFFWPDRTGVAFMTMEEGYYVLQLVELDLMTGNMTGYIYNGSGGWGPEVTQDSLVYTAPGKITNLEDFYG